MKIAVIALPISPFSFFGKSHAGGGQVNLFNLVTHLPSYYKIDIYTSSQKENLPYQKNQNNLNLFELPISRDEIVKNPQKFAKEITNNKSYDFIHAFYYLSGIVGIEVKKQLQIPLVQSFWTLEKIKRYYMKDYIEDKKRVSYEQKIVEKADKIIANTSHEKDDLIHYYHSNPQKIEIIPPGICFNNFYDCTKKESLQKLRLSSNDKYLLFVGRMDPIKGLPILIKALCQLSDVIPNLKLIITGGDKLDSYYLEMQKLIKSCGLENKIIMREAQPHQDLHYYYNSADITIMPSHHETFGLVAMESMSCGTPIIASNVGGLKTFIVNGKNGLLFTKGDVNDLTKKIVYLLQNEKERKRIASSGVKTSKNYTWNKIIKKYLSLYQSLPERI
ncbi:hypothetical protein A2X44_02560 [candidate division CPR3 bacterium GWF2_35_18]|uniref:Glycosyl transferase group 1 n=1 Tax=candidate division CPR3 bacterium GW2011_GWF2_35_18 TaxID=1618350 RepID=A0A0G0BZG3_UNCC3|nr:MAG: hypothetical protein UR67_C0008G0002 [candidate division CPR3 bacterium GW2011_GWF2_35_18]KKP85576.1 MAG: hypothetical protein UR87_C0044G0003 [candidate division CPR3 bacterium GW2011_GWE2_35_7]OGB62474.1 MAG: hypothetical protein A2X44_02560 [candidate division CPR3 bacterium GWF2_35_18]OGB65518.1 MAG: hypothetical protein A2250_04140 [candidate division CPR3 bacterium RIFOXYA2_FULL_35_13]OGB75784.1 MAG: hypothetical protein A2476_01530 [candidate division CPR3 bacterium RIFOXYC2_FULL